jgi:hypothetical protein
VQTCSRCYTQSPDHIQVCPKCQADLREFSATAQELIKFQQNPRVQMVTVSVSDDACPACQQAQGTYAKDQAPVLPVEGCSHVHGCRCHYQPLLSEIYP